MKKIASRTVAALILSAVILAGLVLFMFSDAVRGDTWMAFPSNQHIYSGGVLTSGRILDRDGAVLYDTTDGTVKYNDDKTIRKATLHAVGDASGNIATSAKSAFTDKLVGYDLLNGIYNYGGSGNDLYLTIDADVCKAALKALGSRNGAVGVYNYKTGEIICMVSTPTFDPNNPPEITEENQSSGLYINRFLSSSFTPGSVFKLVAAAAAIDNIPDIFEKEFTCTGSVTIGEGTVTCPEVHGTLDFKSALAFSCNSAFAQIADELGPDILEAYAEKAGFNKGVTVNGIATGTGNFDLSKASDTDVAWSGIGQYTDLANPCAFMTYVGAIANGGVSVIPRLISKSETPSGIPTGLYFKHSGGRVLSADTAETLSDMMHDDVVKNYGESNFPGLDLCAKSGTAEVGGDSAPNAWFAGFIRNEDYPLAFVVLVENGGSGARVAGPIANAALQAAIKAMEK